MTSNTTQKTAAPPTAPTLTLERVFNATPERLWQYWTDPAKYAKWLNPAPIDLVIHEWDLRVGGKVRFDMPQPDGNPNPQEGVFHVLKPYTEIVSGEADKSFLVTVRFAPVGAPAEGRTRMTVEVKGLPAEYHAPATQGWNTGLDKLERLATRHRAHSHVKDRTVHLERWFKAPPEKVFKAWSDPKVLEKFFWPIGQGKVESLSFKPGGQLRMAHATEPWTAIWTFKEIVPNRKIVIVDVWPDGSGLEATGTMEFIPEGGGTRMKVAHGPFPTAGPYQPEAAAGGFSMVAERLAEEVETPGPGEGFVLERHFNAPVKKVWEMWTTKEGLAKWWGPSARQMGYDFKVLKLDVRVGGGYDIVMANKEHGELHNHGVYTEVVPHKRLSQRWDFDIFLGPGEKGYVIPVTIEFEEVSTMEPGKMGTKMTFTQGPMAKPEYTEGSRQGVIQNLRYLEKSLESQ
ncbi:MAG TPA: SRPBCC domain-containing protein [Candidatus Thermoplasmatota archaeon]|nr:SRPBCC domain-containing protein [Candidatus Thermoplasmatota archaeon]